MRSLVLIAALLVALPAGAVDIEYVAVRDPGNPPDTATNCTNAAPDCGSVPYDYAISKYEITNAQYAEFLNHVADPDTYGLWYGAMQITYPPVPIGFKRVYIVNPGFENKPVVYVSFWDAVRFANWLHNGQPFGVEDATTTEDGAYTLTADDIANNRVDRDPAATSFLPTENEWYKAAYHDPALPGYYDYPAGSDTPTTCATPGAASNGANCADVVDALTDVGSYTDSPSPYGTFDQGGNVFEWNEQVVFATARGIRGGSWLGPGLSLGASSAISAGPTLEQEDLGFRVARPLPEPGQALLVLTGGLVLAAARRRHATAL